MNVLVTGGAGYIGAHMVRALLRAGHKVTVVDNLLTGHAEFVPAEVPFVRADVRDGKAMLEVLRSAQIGAIFHFAARVLVGESVTSPRLYFRDNLAGTIELLDAALEAKVSRLVFSSTAAVYGNPVTVPLEEDHPLTPVNPYGEATLATERVLRSYDQAYGLRFVALRYFNAAGADLDAGIGERHDPETHLIPLVLDTALGRRASLTIHGDDYPTPDGTCVRDYIHVSDLVAAHLSALDYLNAGGQSGAFNLGTGKGHSVRQVVQMAERISGRPVPVAYGPRRPGDPAVLVASPARAEEMLGWRATRSSLESIVRDAWAYHKRAFGG